MKKIGIITLVHVRNVGAVLQAFAMKSILEERGFVVEFLKPYGKKEAFDFFLSDMGSVRPRNIGFLLLKNHKFNQVFSLFDERNYAEASLENYKSIILGSDSIWVPKNGNHYMMTKYFGDIEHENVCSYAASTGGISDTGLYSDKQKKALENIRIAGVRDWYTKEFYTEVTGKESEFVLDPTLLIDWKNLDIIKQSKHRFSKGHKYIAVYGGMSDEMICKIRDIAIKKNLDILNIGSYDKRFKNNIAVSPFEFIEYLSNAELVITSMFHGVMLSINMECPFIYYSKDTNRTRKLAYTMENLGFGEAWIQKSGQDINITGVSYPANFREILLEKRKHSILILDKMLEGK